MLTSLAALGALAWVWLLHARGGFWRADRALPRPGELRPDWPEVAILIPARNEAASIGAVLRSHAATRYPGRVSVVLVDDASEDATARIAAEVAREAPRPIHIVAAPPLPEGWTGKLWALETALSAQARLASRARWILLTDADIEHGADTLTRLVDHAERGGFALVSLMARLDDRGFWGGLLVPAFVFFFQKLYPFAWVADPMRDTAGAAGGCVLVERRAVSEIGAMASLRGALIDDCALAGRVKRGPPRRAIWLGLARRSVVSLRDNRRLEAIWTMVARTAFAQLGNSPWQLAGTVAGMAVLYLSGPLAVLLWPLHGSGLAALFGGLAWGLMALAYRPTLRLYGRPAWQGLALPLAAALYTLMTLDSARRHWRGRGGAWKGRTYSELEGGGSAR